MVININCVYGLEHVDALKNCMIPSLLQHNNPSIRLNMLSYDPSVSGRFDNYINGKVTTMEYEPDQSVGFGAAHNILAKQVETSSFIIVNPDCYFFEGSIPNMMSSWTAAPNDVGIIEGRQWPFAHPKAYKPGTFDTHWASGAYCLFDTEKFQFIEGYDPNYFMYLEDVDISWRMWLNGFKVKHEPASVVAHFTGFNHYKKDRLSSEMYYSLRNHILISRKFFGYEVEAQEMRRLSSSINSGLFDRIRVDIEENCRAITQQYDSAQSSKHEMIIFKGMGVYHE